MSTVDADNEQRLEKTSTDNPSFVERKLRHHFEGIRIVSELDLSEDSSLFKMARVVVLKVAQHGKLDRLKRYPAATATFLAGEGSRCYNDGTFWPNTEIYQYFSSPADQTKTGRAFLSALKELALENFDYAASRERWLPYVSPILMHGGIPASYSDDVAELVFTGLRNSIWDAEDLIDWIIQSSALWSKLARPVQRFFEYGDEFASDLLQRMIDTAADIVEFGRDATDLIAELSEDAGLPQYLIRALLTDKFCDTERVQRPPRPTVHIDRYSCNGPYMTLPPFSRGGEWLIQGAVTRRFPTRRHDQLDIPLAPAHGWTATLEWSEHSAKWQSARQFGGLEQVHAYVFDASGKLARQQHRLPADQAFILTPPGVEVIDNDGVPIPSLEELPQRTDAWSGWVLKNLNLEAADSVLVKPPPGLSGDAGPTKLTVTQTTARPKLVTSPVLGATGIPSGSVFAEPPKITVPSEANPKSWRIRWSETRGETEPTAALSTESRRPTTKPLEELPETASTFDSAPLLPSSAAFAGMLEVSGPLGSDIREEIAVIGGLVVDVPDRVFGPREVVEVRVSADVELFLENGTRVSEAGLSFEPGQDTVVLTAQETAFAVTIPRLVWALRRNDGSFPILEGEPLRIGVDEIESGTVESLLVRCGRPTTLRLELRGDASFHEIGPVQTESPVGSWSFALAELRSTIATSVAPRLEVILHVEDLSESLAIVEAQFVVSDLDVSTELDAETTECIVSAEWKENRQFIGRQLRLWSQHRPWQDPICVEVDDSAAGRCEGIVNLTPGPYLAEVIAANEWISQVRPTPSQEGVCSLLVGSETQRRTQLNSLRTEAPLQALELIVGGWVRSRNLDVSAASFATDELTCAIEAVAQLCETDENAMNTLVDLVKLVLTSGDLLPRLAPDLAELPAQALRRLEFIIVSSIQEGPVGITDGDLERLWKTMPTVAAALDYPFVNDVQEDRADASLDRWQRFSGWRPELDATPVDSRIEPVTPPLDEWPPERLRELQQALPPAGSLPLQWGGYLEAAFEMLTNTWHEPTQSSGSNMSPDRERIKQWRSSHHATYSYTQRFSAQQVRLLELVKPKPSRPAWHKFPADILAASFHLIDKSSGRADTAEAAVALRDAAKIAPLLTTRSVLLALGLRHVEWRLRISEND